MGYFEELAGVIKIYNMVGKTNSLGHYIFELIDGSALEYALVLW